MRIVVLLGSGSSTPAGMPAVDEITARVLSGQDVLRYGSDFHVVHRVEPNQEVFTQGVAEVVQFVSDLKQLCDAYFASQDKLRTTNYEDIAYVAQQIEDGLLSEYENPALLPLNERLGARAGRTRRDLMEVAGSAADYVADLVRALVGRPAERLDHLAAIVDATRDRSVGDLTIATLNHDLVLETALGEAEVVYADGFEDVFGTLRLWSDTYAVGDRKVLKLHGSIDWYRYRLTRRGWTGEVTARSAAGEDPLHARGPAGGMLECPLDGRPQILTGTFNKILSYPTGIYADQHFRFHESLVEADRLVVIGYGFRDKAINARLVAWAERPGKRRMVVVHPDRERLRVQARGAVRGKWARWEQRGMLAWVDEYLSPTTSWGAIRGHLV